MVTQDGGPVKSKELRTYTLNRFDFQREWVARTTGTVLNIGSKEDPAKLKRDFGDRVLNCDISTWDTDYNKELDIDVVMDCRETWPFDNDSAELIVMGDVLEHLYLVEALEALSEAYRVSSKICITVPAYANSHRIKGGAELWERPDGSRGHCQNWYPELMKIALNHARWGEIFIKVTDGVVVPEGLLVYAEKV